LTNTSRLAMCAMPAITLDLLDHILPFYFHTSPPPSGKLEPPKRQPSTNLLLVSSAFRHAVLPHIFRTVVVRDLALFFDPEYGLFNQALDGERRWATVRELWSSSSFPLPLPFVMVLVLADCRLPARTTWLTNPFARSLSPQRYDPSFASTAFFLFPSKPLPRPPLSSSLILFFLAQTSGLHIRQLHLGRSRPHFLPHPRARLLSAPSSPFLLRSSDPFHRHP
jgi:hypothetical protein